MSAKIPVSAIICEFDPLHLGHRLLLDAARASGSLVCCVMSGSFTQRAAPAMLDKWTRARLALENGADLVAELPLSWACAGAERFAAGGVALAAALGAEELWFGSETPDAQRLDRLAEALLSPAFTQALHSQPDAGQSFAVRRQQAAASLLGEEADILAQPNANLAVEYCKAIRRQGASLRPRPIQRQGAGHGQRDEPLPPGQPGYLSARARLWTAWSLPPPPGLWRRPGPWAAVPPTWLIWSGLSSAGSGPCRPRILPLCRTWGKAWSTACTGPHARPSR